ncbi:hypothetical protein SAMN02982917_6745 [Azospirillum oryzae]|uniref:Uncharacterized protein n=1 Tax=Azospirillum oryzae TaxID=286727 RepID=A0A1X7HNQ4_9PROT|nr:hypothetical protein SAMN02982917_6745 [Azospirillum oryzae]
MAACTECLTRQQPAQAVSACSPKPTPIVLVSRCVASRNAELPPIFIYSPVPLHEGMQNRKGPFLSLQARRHVRRSRSCRRRHSPSRVQQANRVYNVPNGMPVSCSMARHHMLQKHTHQIAKIALRSAAPVRGSLGPVRAGRVPSLAIAVSPNKHLLDKGIGIRERVPGGWGGACGTNGSAHRMRVQAVTSRAADRPDHAPAATPLLSSK